MGDSRHVNFCNVRSVYLSPLPESDIDRTRHNASQTFGVFPPPPERDVDKYGPAGYDSIRNNEGSGSAGVTVDESQITKRNRMNQDRQLVAAPVVEDHSGMPGNTKAGLRRRRTTCARLASCVRRWGVAGGGLLATPNDDGSLTNVLSAIRQAVVSIDGGHTCRSPDLPI